MEEVYYGTKDLNHFQTPILHIDAALNKKQHYFELKEGCVGLPMVNPKTDALRSSGSTHGKNTCKSSTVDPLAKREAFARDIRNQIRNNKIQSKRAQNRNQEKDLQLNLLSSNCRGLNSSGKQVALADLINKYEVDVMALQETKLTRRLWIKGFKTIQTQLIRRGGCLCATSLSDCKAIKTLNTSLSWLIIVHCGVPIHLLSLYIDPCNAEAGEKTIQDTVSIVSSLFRRTKRPRLIIAGDFNQKRQVFDRLAAEWNLNEILPLETKTHKLGGALDQVYTNLEVIEATQLEIDEKYSDHTPILCILRFKRDFKDYNMKQNVLIRRQWQLREAAASKTTLDYLLQAPSILAADMRNIIEQQVKPQKLVRRWYEGVKHHHPTAITDSVAPVDQENSGYKFKKTLTQLEMLHKEGRWKEFFRLVRALTKLKMENPTIRGLKVRDQIIQDPESIEEEITSYYMQIYGGEKTELPSSAPTCMNIFSMTDIHEAINETNFNKGLGPDLFNGAILLQSPELRTKVEQELQLTLNNGNIPLCLGDGRLIALSKLAGRDVVSMDETRPIIVRSHLSKIAEKAIKKKIEASHPHLLATNASQSGFKSGKGTKHNITKILQLMHPGRGRKKKKILLMVDLKKAFDSLDRTKLMAILFKRCKTQEDEHIVKLMVQLHINNKVFVGNREFVANKGVAQGSVLAPLLFNVYLEEAISQSPLLRRKYENGSMLAFADDLIIVMENQEEVVRVIKELGQLHDYWNLTLNKEKSLIIGLQNAPEVEGIRCNDTGKYLGFKLHVDPIQQRRLVQEQIKKNLKYIRAKLRCTNNDVKECLIHSYARSLLQYFATPMRAAGLWSQHQVMDIENQLYREAHGIPRDIRTQDLMNITSHSFSATTIIEQQAKKLRLKIEGSQNLCKWGRTEEEKMSIQRPLRKKLFLPKGITETLLALTRGRTTVYFGSGHYCLEHKSVVDEEHLGKCHHTQGFIDVSSLVDLIRQSNIHDWNEETRNRILLGVAQLKGKLSQLTEAGIYLHFQVGKLNQRVDQSQEAVKTTSVPVGTISCLRTEKTNQEHKKRGRPKIQSLLKKSNRSLHEYYSAKV